MYKPFYPTLALATVCALPANAAEHQPLTIVITGTRTELLLEQATASTTVITREEIDRRQPGSVAELLQSEAGVAFASNGGAFQNTSLFLRGTGSQHTLLLVDGVRVRSATSGAPAWAHIPVSEIERIEIVRGPQSGLYGADAIGGVIQVFTRRGSGAPRVHAALTAGTRDTYEARIGGSGSVDATRFSANLSALTTDGINVTANGSEPDRDGAERFAASLSLDHDFGNGTELGFTALRNEDDFDFDGSWTNEGKSTQQVLGTSLRHAVTDGWAMRWQLAQSRDLSDNFLNAAPSFSFETRTDQFTWQNEFQLATDSELTVGFDWYDDQVGGTTAYDVSDRSNRAVFAAYQGRYGAHDVQLSARRDDNEAYGMETTGRLGWGYAINDALRLTASYGNAFKAPNFNELFYPGWSNPALKPERSRTAEAGISGGNGYGRWMLTAFETRVDDLIAGGVNVAEARIQGLELTGSTRLNGWNLSASATFMDPRDETNGEDLIRRPRRSARLAADREFGRWSLGADLVAQSARADMDFSSWPAAAVTVPGYAVLGVHAAYAFSEDLLLRLRVNNLLDRDYQSVFGYNQPGTEALLTLEYRPQ